MRSKKTRLSASKLSSSKLESVQELNLRFKIQSKVLFVHYYNPLLIWNHCWTLVLDSQTRKIKHRTDSCKCSKYCCWGVVWQSVVGCEGNYVDRKWQTRAGLLEKSARNSSWTVTGLGNKGPWRFWIIANWF